jgi:hypothetical protein
MQGYCLRIREKPMPFLCTEGAGAAHFMSLDGSLYPQDGLGQMEGCRIKLSLEDLDSLTENKALCNPAGELAPAHFEQVCGAGAGAGAG